MARNYSKHKVNGCELKSSRGCVFSRPSLLPLPRRRREGESGLPTIESFLRSVWLVIGFGKSWALLRIFGLRTQPGSRQGIRYWTYGQEAHWHTYTQPLLLRCLYSTQEPVCMKQDRNAIEMCDQSKYRKERRLVYKRSSQEKKKIRLPE